MEVAHIPLLDPAVQSALKSQLAVAEIDSSPPGQWKINSYLDTFTNWIQSSSQHRIIGLDEFKYRAYSSGTVDSIAEFICRHTNSRRLRFSRAEFILSKIVSNSVNNNWTWLESEPLESGDALVVSLPFSGNGSTIPDFDTLLDTCDQLDIPVLIDLAYLGISYDLDIDLTHTCITDVTCSLSKPLNSFLRCGIRFTRELHDDRVQLMSDLGVVNRVATKLAEDLMLKFPGDYIFNTYKKRYEEVCAKLGLEKTNTLTLALGNAEQHQDFLRNGFYRICITNELIDQTN